MDLIDKGALIKWVSDRQMALEGGFNGRSNKVVDACYTFWIGAVFKLLSLDLDMDISPSHIDL